MRHTRTPEQIEAERRYNRNKAILVAAWLAGFGVLAAFSVIGVVFSVRWMLGI